MRRPNRFRSEWTRALVLCALIIAGAPGCSDDPSSPAPEPGNVAVETSKRVQETIGPAGGSLTTTSTAGIEYTLEIPVGALPGDVQITMTPVTSISGLPYSGGIEGAVALAPSGLEFLVPATLTIGATAMPTGTQRLVGFSYEGDAARFELAPGGQAGGEIRLLVPHFSGAGAAMAEPGDLPGNTDCENLGPSEPLSVVITTCVEAGNRTAFLDVMQRVFDDIIAPAIQNGAGDVLQEGIRDYLQWRALVEGGLAEVYAAGDAEAVFADRILDAEVTISGKLEAGIADAKAQCASTSDIQWLIEIFEFRALAFAVFEGLPPGLDDATTLEGICATAVIESTELADPLPQNVDRSLDIDFALDLGGTLTDAAFRVTVTDPDNLVRTPEGRTDAQGRYTTVVRRLIPEGASFHVTGTLILPVFGAAGLGLTEVPITVEDEVFRGGNARITTNLPVALAPNQARALDIRVERLTQSGYQPVDAAQVSLAVTGGSANPEQATTDAAGFVETSLTPSTGADSVVVHITVRKDGDVLGEKRVAAAIVEGGVVLFERFSGAQTFGVSGNVGCSGSGEWFAEDYSAGHSSIAAQSDEECANLAQETTRTAFASLISNPGITGDSATMTMQSSGTVYASHDACMAAQFCTEVSSSAQTQFRVAFDVTGGMAYQIDIAYDAGAEPRLGDSVTVSLVRQAGTSPVVFQWSGSPGDFLQVGNLIPGPYVLYCGVFRSSGATPGGEAQTVTWNLDATLTLTQPAVATAAGGR